jgi:hypothetical protein
MQKQTTCKRNIKQMKDRIILVLFILLISNVLIGQNNNKSIIGSWVKISATFQDGGELPINNPFNQTYLRFDFTKNGKAYKTINPLDKGYIFDYLINGNNLKIGFVNYIIKEISSDSLILIEESRNGFDNSAIKYLLIRERNYQNALPLVDETLIVRKLDTIYIESEKIRAKFIKEESFREFLNQNIIEYSNVISEDNYFMATFIINKNGRIDSIEIHKGINKTFDKQFIKAVYKSSGLWEPAKLNDKNVNVLHTEIFKFVSNPNFEKQYYNYQNGVIAMQREKFDAAIDFFCLTLSSNPNDIDALFQRGICYFKLNLIDKACADWQKIKTLKSKRADNLILEFCK